MKKNEYIQCLADHAAFLSCLSTLTNQTDEIKKLMKNSAEYAYRAAASVLTMMEYEDRNPKKPEA